MIEPILKNVLKPMNFIFWDWGKNPSHLDTMELTDSDTRCTGSFRTRGRRYVMPLDPSFRAMVVALIRAYGL